MKSFTIHGLEGQLFELIKAKAQNEGVSLNKAIKKLLEESLGVKARREMIHKEDFKEFCGVWSKSDCDAFNNSIKDFEKIDKGEWE